MTIDDLRRGQRLRPLDSVEVAAGPGRIQVFDGKGREYVSQPIGDGLTFLIGGALGWHRALVGHEPVLREFLVEAKTDVQDKSGQFHDLLQMLHFTMVSEFGEAQSCLWNGKIYQYFICWLRDHVHVLKGMKYFHGELKSAIELYRDSQRADGMIYDNCYSRGPDENYWIVRFTEGDFYKSFEDKTFEFKRIPVENDVEYLFVEGVYFTWKATGDDAWMVDCLDSCERALEYSVASEHRWSEKYQLLKRGYTIDTWDFQNSFDTNVEGDHMRVRPGTTRFGVMFGDNTGFIAACRQLAEMLEAGGAKDQGTEGQRTRDRVQRLRRRADEMEERLEQVAWRGTHFQHHVREEAVEFDFGVDEESQVSLSNAYSLNRGIGADKSQAIIRKYQEIHDNLPSGSPGEWYTIYPPFEQGYDGPSNKWQYMNASVTPIVAGELSHGAFQNGYEAYGANILQRLIDLGHKHCNKFHCSYTGSHEPPPIRSFQTIDLTESCNSNVRGQSSGDVTGWDNAPNDFRELPGGLQTFCDVPFKISEDVRNAVSVSEREVHPDWVTIPIGAMASCLYFFHTVSGGVGTAGTLTIRYDDQTEVKRSVVKGRDVVGWWMPDEIAATGRRTMDIGWKGKNSVLPYIAACVWGCDNPHPDKKIVEIQLNCAPEDAQWHVMGLTLSDHPAWFPTNPISFGIPNGWGAAAVVYALIEGLVGVVDSSTAFVQPEISPRWPASGETKAKVCVHYPASGGYVAYEYSQCDELIQVDVTGSGESATLRTLLPRDWIGGSVFVDGAEVPASTESILKSHYLVCSLANLRPTTIQIKRKPTNQCSH
ncbi:MAG: hypothetical protein H7Y17_14440 [Chlorobia bacterium]|nr:hypothetical protein [Fimbriimonadaceae bacterium]